MTEEVASAGLVAGVLGGIYVAVLVALAVASRRARRERSLSDFYLAGRELGPAVLLFTLFATQYSGNSLSGFPGQTYREGLSYYMSVTFMVAIVSGYLLFAPRLYTLSRRDRYVTPTDYLAARFSSPVLNVVSAVILTITLVNFLLAQLMAMGHAVSGLSGGAAPYWTGVVGGAIVILTYELLGGMRAVAWTDALQGVILLVGLCCATGLLIAEVGSPAEVVASVAAVAPGKVASPDLRVCLVWISNMALLGLGAPLYPQAIQRIYAARTLRGLRRSLATMAFLPHLAISTVVFLGVVGIALFPALDAVEADGVTFRVLAHLVEVQPLALVPVTLVLLAVLAAIMSTADSCLLSLSSIFTKDIVARARGLSGDRAERLAGLAPVVSITVMSVLVLIALRPLTTLWGLLVIKFEILIQLSPSFVLGTRHEAGEPGAYRSRDILRGLAVGLTVAVGLYALDLRVWNGLHAGSLGVVANYLTCVASRRFAAR